MFTPKNILLAALLAITVAYIAFWFMVARRHRREGRAAPGPVALFIGFVTNFFDTLGIGSFATTTSMYRLWHVVPDERIPGTLNVGHTLPTVTQALIYITIVAVDFQTLVLLIAAAVAGSWLGAGIVAGLPRRKIQIGMGLALLGAASLMAMTALNLFPGGGEALALTGPRLVIGCGVNFMLGALMTLGIGLYAPCMIMISLLGMNPTAAFPIMMGSCAFLMPTASMQFIRKEKYDVRAAIGLAIGGIPAVLIAAFIVRSLPLYWVRWLVVAVVVYTATAMLRSAAIESARLRTATAMLALLAVAGATLDDLSGTRGDAPSARSPNFAPPNSQESRFGSCGGGRWEFLQVQLCASPPEVSQTSQQKPEQYQIRVEREQPKAEPAKPDAKPDDKEAETLPDVRRGKKNEGPNSLPPYDRMDENGVLPASVLHDGGTYLPVDQRVPEVFQWMEPREQIRQGQLLGSQLPPVLTEFRMITKELRPGEEARAVARVSAMNKPRPMVSLFFHQEAGRSKPAVYMNFEPSKQDPNLFLGRGLVSEYALPGRYMMQEIGTSDENGHRKIYSPDFFPLLQDEEGAPVAFNVLENPRADGDAPILKRVEIETRRVKTEDDIHFSVWAVDRGPSGLSEAQAYWISPSGRQSMRVDMVRLFNEPGRFRASFQVPKWYEGGEWKLLGLMLADKANNETNLFPASEPMLRSLTTYVEADPAVTDLEAPILLAMQFSHDALQRDKGMQITALVEDNLSGVKDVYVSFLSPYGADFNRVKLSNDAPNLNRRSQAKQVNVFRGELKLKPTQEPGRWVVGRVNLADNASNFRNYNANRDAIIKGMIVFFIDPRMKPGAASSTTQK
jgi:uncharacterized membrane protein YfcA